jgi:AMP-binding enzyme
MARLCAGKTPNKAALIDADGVVTYAQLNERSNRVANELARTGIRPGYHVGLDFSRSGLDRRRNGLLAVAGRQLHHRNLYPGRRWCAERQAGMVGTATRAPQRTELGDGSLGPFSDKSTNQRTNR